MSSALESQARPDSWWHALPFREAVEEKDAFAAAFHYRWFSATLQVAMPAVPFGLPLGGPCRFGIRRAVDFCYHIRCDYVLEG